MKKLTAILLTLVLAFALVSCGSQTSGGNTSSETVVLKVGASPSPHAEILEVVKDDLAAQGIDLQIVEFDDYVLPNTSTEDGSLDANYFQHTPYLEDFNATRGTHLVSVAVIHYEPLGIYTGKSNSLDVADGAVIGVPNDATNEARALLLLEASGLLTLDPNAGLNATVLDITSNPKNLKIEEIEAAQLTAHLEDLDLAVINGNYAVQAGLSAKDALAFEDKDSEAANIYGNVLVVKEGNENNPAVLALADALRTDKVRKFIEDNYAGVVVPKF
ncbi:MAG: metal ABC transporter substrate-binding protein [Oscillospiraceae bacterium]|nr:metal ABC transporter substrate-binding protein [Oscillospiraceae bacterium]